MEEEDIYQARAAIGSRIRQYRNEAGLTQINLSEALGHRSSQRVNQIELGRARLYADELAAICRVLRCSVTDIVYGGPLAEETDFQKLIDRLEPSTRKLLVRALHSVIQEKDAPCANLQRKLHQLSEEQLVQIDSIVSTMIPHP